MSYTFAVADLHGRFDLLQEAIARIEHHSTSGTVVFTGDYVDRGPFSSDVIERLMAGPDDPSRWRWICQMRGSRLEPACIREDQDSMSEMAERVSSAILAKVPTGYGMTKAEAAEYARVAIEAMRDPDRTMLVASDGALRAFRKGLPPGAKLETSDKFGGYWVHPHTKAAIRWRAMIDAALCA